MDLYDSLLLFARQWDAETAEDVVQDAIVKYFDKTLNENGEKPENSSAWLFTVVRNESISRLRKKKTAQNHERNCKDSASNWFENSQETQLDAKLVAEKLLFLPHETREIIVAKIWGGLSFDEIAKAFGTSKSSAHRK
ncbi:MAG: RNA polymerase sigma factor, partial [Thermoguttaceae bacterium]